MRLFHKMINQAGVLQRLENIQDGPQLRSMGPGGASVCSAQSSTSGCESIATSTGCVVSNELLNIEAISSKDCCDCELLKSRVASLEVMLQNCLTRLTELETNNIPAPQLCRSVSVATQPGIPPLQSLSPVRVPVPSRYVISARTPISPGYCRVPYP